MIRTRFLGPTDHRRSRVIAHSVGVGNRVGFRLTKDWDDALDARANFEAAAIELQSKLASNPVHADHGLEVKVYSCSEDGGGYVFAFVPTEVQS